MRLWLELGSPLHPPRAFLLSCTVTVVKEAALTPTCSSVVFKIWMNVLHSAHQSEGPGGWAWTAASAHVAVEKPPLVPTAPLHLASTVAEVVSPQWVGTASHCFNLWTLNRDAAPGVLVPLPVTSWGRLSCCSALWGRCSGRPPGRRSDSAPPCWPGVTTWPRLAAREAGRRLPAGRPHPGGGGALHCGSVAGAQRAPGTLRLWKASNAPRSKG